MYIQRIQWLYLTVILSENHNIPQKLQDEYNDVIKQHSKNRVTIIHNGLYGTGEEFTDIGTGEKSIDIKDISPMAPFYVTNTKFDTLMETMEKSVQTPTTDRILYIFPKTLDLVHQQLGDAENELEKALSGVYDGERSKMAHPIKDTLAKQDSRQTWDEVTRNRITPYYKSMYKTTPVYSIYRNNNKADFFNTKQRLVEIWWWTKATGHPFTIHYTVRTDLRLPSPSDINDKNTLDAYRAEYKHVLREEDITLLYNIMENPLDSVGAARTQSQLYTRTKTRILNVLSERLAFYGRPWRDIFDIYQQQSQYVRDIRIFQTDITITDIGTLEYTLYVRPSGHVVQGPIVDIQTLLPGELIKTNTEKNQVDGDNAQNNAMLQKQLEKQRVFVQHLKSTAEDQMLTSPSSYKRMCEFEQKVYKYIEACNDYLHDNFIELSIPTSSIVDGGANVSREFQNRSEKHAVDYILRTNAEEYLFTKQIRVKTVLREDNLDAVVDETDRIYQRVLCTDGLHYELTKALYRPIGISKTIKQHLGVHGQRLRDLLITLFRTEYDLNLELGEIIEGFSDTLATVMAPKSSVTGIKLTEVLGAISYAAVRPLHPHAIERIVDFVLGLIDDDRMLDFLQTFVFNVQKMDPDIITKVGNELLS